MRKRDLNLGIPRRRGEGRGPGSMRSPLRVGGQRNFSADGFVMQGGRRAEAELSEWSGEDRFWRKPRG